MPRFFRYAAYAAGKTGGDGGKLRGRDLSCRKGRWKTRWTSRGKPERERGLCVAACPALVAARGSPARHGGPGLSRALFGRWLSRGLSRSGFPETRKSAPTSPTHHRTNPAVVAAAVQMRSLRPPLSFPRAQYHTGQGSRQAAWTPPVVPPGCPGRRAAPRAQAPPLPPAARPPRPVGAVAGSPAALALARYLALKSERRKTT